MNIPCYAVTGFVNDGKEGGSGSGMAVMAAAVVLGKLEDLEAMLGDGNAHAKEKLMVEVGDVFLFKLVLGEKERVLVEQIPVEPG